MILTPGAVATTLYGARYNFNPACSNMLRNISITCRASMSWKQGQEKTQAQDEQRNSGNFEIK